MFRGTDIISWNVLRYFPHSLWMWEIYKGCSIDCCRSHIMRILENVLWNIQHPTEHCYGSE